MEAQEQILVIDDEPSVADALRMILEDCGFGVFVASTAREGIEQARRARFGVTITDLRLPDLDGLDVIRAVREADASVAVILITSHYTPEVQAQARARGAVGVIAKPFLPSEIIESVAAALAQRGPDDSTE
ncbi:MAG TPA: response regulator [Pyrinomonadaceae bacterium]|nr:response regulator [Pyrinomonadaceae bacterium]